MVVVDGCGRKVEELAVEQAGLLLTERRKTQKINCRVKPRLWGAER